MDLNQQIANNIEEILLEIGITDYTKFPNRLTMTCPVHCGDNSEACSIFTDNNKFVPNWKCFTHECHKGKSSLTSLVSILLEKNYSETKSWLKDFGIKDEVSKVSKEDYQFIKNCKTLNITNRDISETKIQTSLLGKLEKPVGFYLDRGFLPSTLDEFGVGICREKDKNLFNRIVVPIYADSSKEYVLGCVGRTIHPKCPICKKYHHKYASCLYKSSKWKNSKNFNTNSYFYNYWNAEPIIQSTGKVYLVEGQADVWRFWEAGIKNVLGLFGVDVSTEQQVLLEKSGATNVTLFLDPDKAGEDAVKRCVENLSRFYTLSNIDYEKQPSECSIEELIEITGKTWN